MQNSKLQLKIQKFGRGFTLIELLIAISIIGILSSFLLANFIGIRQRARDGIRKSDLKSQIQSGLELYRSDQSSYPASPLPACGSSLKNPTGTVIYIQRVACDPLNPTTENYLYDSPPGNATYCLRACLENINDSDRDEKTFESNNPKSISGCDLLDCPDERRSYTLQNP